MILLNSQWFCSILTNSFTRCNFFLHNLLLQKTTKSRLSKKLFSHCHFLKKMWHVWNFRELQKAIEDVVFEIYFVPKLQNFLIFLTARTRRLYKENRLKPRTNQTLCAVSHCVVSRYIIWENGSYVPIMCNSQMQRRCITTMIITTIIIIISEKL